MYDLNELVPVVAMLTRQYTGIESSSVTYEKANQLMEAVLYCIREVEQSGEAVLVSQQQSAMQAYKTGARLVRKKTEELFIFYECHKQEFHAYGNGCLADILQKGIPTFFQYYDEKYDPQNTILTLDYPIFVDLSAYQGIDCVDLYVRNLAEEQRFLAKFGENYVRSVLCAFPEDYEELSENIAGIVFGNIIGHLTAGKKLTEALCNADLQRIYGFYAECEREGKGRFQVRVSESAEAFLLQYYAGMKQLQRYMMTGLTDILTRIETAAAYENLDKVFVV
ncbi:MAG: hypothetical protein K2H91_08370 [Lachnospiraceae bacterium]|nr:hypothetical protein [Lachnospiraceae bacterium]